MTKTALETDLWPIIFKSLSDKQISYAVTPNTYPKETDWKECSHHEISIMLEDPDRPHKPDGGALFSCWLVFKKYKELHINIDLSISLPRSVDIKEVLTIMENEYFNNYPELILERHPKLGSSYTLNFQFSILSYSWAPLSSFAPGLQKAIKMIDEIVHTLYIIEKNPQDKKALEGLTNFLLEMQ